MSSSYAEIIAGKQPDGTQGIAVVDFQGSDGSLKELVGCAIHLSPSDKSNRNVLKIEERHKKVIYFIFLPWFNSCRPNSLNEIKSISVKLHHYKEADSAGKKFSINNIDAMASYFEKYKNDRYFVIPCEDENFTKSSFLKNWSSELLLHNNSDQLFQAQNFFTGFKKDGDQHPGKSLFKYCKFDLKKSSGGAQSGYYVDEELEEQGVLMIRNEKEKESYVVGCYLKKPSEIKLFCFLLKGLAEISTKEAAERSQDSDAQGQPAETEEERRNNNAPGQPTATVEGRSHNDTHQGQQPPSVQHCLASDSVDGINDSPWSTPDNPEEEWSGQVRNQEMSQESEDGIRGSSELAAPRHSNVPRNSEDESKKRKIKELIHKTFGPKVIDMPYEVKDEAGSMLNYEQSSGNDYRAVADKVGVQHHKIKNLSRSKNPMEDVFEVIISQVKTVNDFVDILNEIKRGDVVDKMYEMALLKSKHS